VIAVLEKISKLGWLATVYSIAIFSTLRSVLTVSGRGTGTQMGAKFTVVNLMNRVALYNSFQVSRAHTSSRRGPPKENSLSISSSRNTHLLAPAIHIAIRINVVYDVLRGPSVLFPCR